MNSNYEYQSKSLKCGGKWGSSCNIDGKCGSGEIFFGLGKCQSANWTVIIPSLPVGSGISISTTAHPAAPTPGRISPGDSCGGINGYQCPGLSSDDYRSLFGFCGRYQGIDRTPLDDILNHFKQCWFPKDAIRDVENRLSLQSTVRSIAANAIRWDTVLVQKFCTPNQLESSRRLTTKLETITIMSPRHAAQGCQQTNQIIIKSRERPYC